MTSQNWRKISARHAARQTSGQIKNFYNIDKWYMDTGQSTQQYKALKYT